MSEKRPAQPRVGRAGLVGVLAFVALGGVSHATEPQQKWPTGGIVVAGENDIPFLVECFSVGDPNTPRIPLKGYMGAGALQGNDMTLTGVDLWHEGQRATVPTSEAGHLVSTAAEIGDVHMVVSCQEALPLGSNVQIGQVVSIRRTPEGVISEVIGPPAPFAAPR